MENNLARLFKETLIRDWEYPRFTDYRGRMFRTSEVASEIKALHQLFADLGVERGDKIGIIGRNSSRWAIVYIAGIMYGAVVVPILPDFRKDEVLHIVEHSETKLLFINQNLYENLEVKVPNLLGVYDHGQDYKLLQGEKEKMPTFDGSIIAQKDELHYNPLHENELSVLSYTSGTSGFSKGVMLSAKNLYSNVQFALDELKDVKQGERIVSFLPLAHSFGCTFEFLWPFCAGAHIYFIEKIPTPTLLVSAFQEVKPKVVIMVPLLVEKIYKKKIQPILESPKIKILTKIPLLKNLVYKKMNKSLYETFGGNFYTMVVGGAALNPEVEAFLQKIKFPITVGYGMTECAPLISYVDWKKFKAQSCGKSVNRMEIKIDKGFGKNAVGEIMTKGDNVMLGYYKNPEATEDAIDKKGWLHTGDLGELDKNGLLYIRGRSKNMLLGPSGQNIYPEEIEALLNNIPMVSESLVVDDRESRLVALIYPDPDFCQEQGWNQEQIREMLNTQRRELNKDLPGFKQIYKVVVVDEEFEKTPKRSVKRYKYTNLDLDKR